MNARVTQRRVFTIAPGASFLSTFAEALLAGAIIPGFPDRNDPLSLSRARLYVPTRRAGRALASELARRAPFGAALLPDIAPLGALDEQETESLFAPPLSADDFDAAAQSPIDPLTRRLALMRLVRNWSEAKGRRIALPAQGAMSGDDEPLLTIAGPAQAFHLAGELGALLDEFIIEGVAWERLRTLAPEGLDAYFQITLDFLAIVGQQWPAALAALGLVERAQRQNERIDAQARRLAEGASDGPQIVVGSTGANAATARLIAAIARSRDGAVVLPGLDMLLDDTAWRFIGADDDGAPAHSHPQATLRRLLPLLGVRRDDVVELGALDDARDARRRFISAAMQPADTTHTWRAFDSSGLGEALRDVSVIEAPGEREEALALALVLRETLEHPGRTAALITPDRALARRVRAELQRWQVEVDDSGGDPLAGEPFGALARLSATCVARCARTSDAAALLALLRHPLTQLGRTREQAQRVASLIERGVLRGASLSLDTLETSIVAARDGAKSGHALRRWLSDDDWVDIHATLAMLKQALAPMRALTGRPELSVWADAHRRVLEALRAPSPLAQESAPDARALIDILTRLATTSSSGHAFDAQDYADFLDAALREETVRGPVRAHPRIKILGLLETRLLSADLHLLAGLDESVWPPQARVDPFLNRPMRAALGLSPPERRLGQTAHDFTQALGAPRIVLSHARKRDGAPTTPSRFLQRMAALAGPQAWSACRARGEEWLRLAERLDATAGPPQPVKRPQPRPALALRPTQLSVTRIETLRRDPYAIYAESILRLAPIEPLTRDNNAAALGVLTHDALAAYHDKVALATSLADAQAAMETIARDHFAEALNDPAFIAFRWPGLMNVLGQFVAWDHERRAGARAIHVEQKGALAIALADGATFTLTARADRIEARRDGALAVIDIKTGKIPSQKEIAAGFSPQLTLEAAMLERGAFRSIAAGSRVVDVQYVRLRPRQDLHQSPVGDKTPPLADMIRDHYDGLLQLLEQFRDPLTPYLPRTAPQFAARATPYDHLSRYKEWSAGAGEGEAS